MESRTDATDTICTMVWTRSPQDTLMLPIDALALLILQDYQETRGWNWHNWILESQQHGTASDPQISEALSEGWAWLMTHGLVMRNPSQHSADAYQLTRLGRETLQFGIGNWPQPNGSAPRCTRVSHNRSSSSSCSVSTTSPCSSRCEKWRSASATWPAPPTRTWVPN
jgi:hypothetical protein